MIKNSDISKNAKIDPSKIAPAPKEGEILLSQDNGKFAPVKLSGDVSVNKNGIVRIKNIDGITKEIQNYRDELNAERGGHDALTKSDLKEGKTLVGGAAGPEEIAVGSGSGAIPQRDSSGNLKAETSDNADKLDNQEGTYYTDVSNHTSGAVSSTTNAGQGLTYATQTKPLKELVADFDYSANGTGYGGTSLPVITHNFGYVPSCKIYKVTGSNLEEIEMNVVSTTTTTTISFNYINHDLKIILR